MSTWPNEETLVKLESKARLEGDAVTPKLTAEIRRLRVREKNLEDSAVHRELKMRSLNFEIETLKGKLEKYTQIGETT